MQHHIPSFDSHISLNWFCVIKRARSIREDAICKSPYRTKSALNCGLVLSSRTAVRRHHHHRQYIVAYICFACALRHSM